MHKYISLLRVNFKALLQTMLGSSRGQKKNGPRIGLLCLISFTLLYVSGVYSFLLAHMLKPAGFLTLMPVIMGFVICLASMMVTAFGASGIVFGGGDMDFMFSLPISAFAVMLSKILALYLENLLICTFLVVPSGAAYLYYGGAGGAVFLLRLLAAMFLLALIPTFFAVLIGFILAWIQGRFRNKAIIENLCYLLFTFGAIAASLKINAFAMQLIQNGEKMNRVFSTWLYPIGLYRDSIYGSLTGFICFAAVTVLPFLALVYLFSRRYKSILSRLTTHAMRSDYKLGTLLESGQLAALFKKEIRRYFGTPIYLFNTGIGVMLGIGGSIFACVKKDMLLTLMHQSGVSLFPLLLLVFGFLFVMTSPACVSISLEGKTLWILKEAPIPVWSILLAKAGWNAVLIWGTGIICLPLLWYAFSFTMAEACIFLLFAAGCGILTSSMNIWINLLFPKMDGVNDTLIVKQSLAVIVSLFGGFALLGIGAALYVLLSPLNQMLFFTLVGIVTTLAGAVLWILLRKKGEKRFLKL